MPACLHVAVSVVMVNKAFLSAYYKALYYYNFGRFSVNRQFAFYAYLSSMIFFTFIISVVLAWSISIGKYFFGYNWIYISTSLVSERLDIGQTLVNLNTIELTGMGTVILWLSFWMKFLHRDRYKTLLIENKKRLKSINTYVNWIFFIFLILMFACVAFSQNIRTN